MTASAWILAEITIRKQIEQLVQLNEGQPYTYEREARSLLDETLAQCWPERHKVSLRPSHVADD